MIRNNLLTFLAITLGFANAMEGAAAAVDRHITFCHMSGDPLEALPTCELPEVLFNTFLATPNIETISGPLEGFLRRSLGCRDKIAKFVKHDDNKVYAILTDINVDFKIIDISPKKCIYAEVSMPDCPPETKFRICFYLAPDQEVLKDFFEQIELGDTTTMEILDHDLGLRSLIKFKPQQGDNTFVKASPFALKALCQSPALIPESLENEVLMHFYVSDKNILEITDQFNLAIKITGCPQAEIYGNNVFLEQLSEAICYRVLIGPLGNRKNFTIMSDPETSHCFRLTEYNLGILKAISCDLSTCDSSTELFGRLLEAGITVVDANTV